MFSEINNIIKEEKNFDLDNSVILARLKQRNTLPNFNHDYHIRKIDEYFKVPHLSKNVTLQTIREMPKYLRQTCVGDQCDMDLQDSGIEKKYQEPIETKVPDQNKPQDPDKTNPQATENIKVKKIEQQTTKKNIQNSSNSQQYKDEMKKDQEVRSKIICLNYELTDLLSLSKSITFKDSVKKIITETKDIKNWSLQPINIKDGQGGKFKSYVIFLVQKSDVCTDYSNTNNTATMKINLNVEAPYILVGDAVKMLKHALPNYVVKKYRQVGQTTFLKDTSIMPQNLIMEFVPK